VEQSENMAPPQVATEKARKDLFRARPTSLAEIISTSLLADTPRFPIRSRFEDGHTLPNVSCDGYRAIPETMMGRFAEVNESLLAMRHRKAALP
jgi:hypothetical protein